MQESSNKMAQEATNHLKVLDQLIEGKHYLVVLNKLNQLIADMEFLLPSYYHYRAFVYYLLEKSKAALADLAKVMEHYPLCFSRTYVLLGLIYRDLKQAPEASIKYFDQAMKINYLDLDCYFELIRTYQKLNQVDKALTVIEQASHHQLDISAFKMIQNSLLQAKITTQKTSSSLINKHLKLSSVKTQQKSNNTMQVSEPIMPNQSFKHIQITSMPSCSPQQTTKINTMAIAWGVDVDDYKAFFDENEEKKSILTLRNV